MIFVKKQNNNTKNDFWIGFSDLMTGLMLVFIILSLTFMAIAKQKLDENQKKQDKIIKILQDELGSNGVALDVDNEKGTISVAQDILFDQKKSTLSPNGKVFIKLFSTILDTKIFNNSETANLIDYIHIEGYASREGSENENFIYGFNRAKNVWLNMTHNKLHNKDIMKRKLNIVSRGEIEANQSIDDRKDRKVVFRFEFDDSIYKNLLGISK